GADSATTSATVLDRLSPRGRLVGLDVARGIDLLAMMVTNIFALGDETGMPTWAAAFAGRASALLAVLAGCLMVLSKRSRLDESGRQIVADTLMLFMDADIVNSYLLFASFTVSIA